MASLQVTKNRIGPLLQVPKPDHIRKSVLFLRINMETPQEKSNQKTKQKDQTKKMNQTKPNPTFLK